MDRLEMAANITKDVSRLRSELYKYEQLVKETQHSLNRYKGTVAQLNRDINDKETIITAVLNRLDP